MRDPLAQVPTKGVQDLAHRGLNPGPRSAVPERGQLKEARCRGGSKQRRAMSRSEKSLSHRERTEPTDPHQHNGPASPKATWPFTQRRAPAAVPISPLPWGCPRFSAVGGSPHPSHPQQQAPKRLQHSHPTRVDPGSGSCPLQAQVEHCARSHGIRLLHQPESAYHIQKVQSGSPRLEHTWTHERQEVRRS